MQIYFIVLMMSFVVSYSLYCKEEDSKLSCHRLLMVQAKNRFKAVSNQLCTGQKTTPLPYVE